MLLIRCYVILLLQNQFYIGPDTTGNGSKVVMAVQSDGKGDRFLWQKISLWSVLMFKQFVPSGKCELHFNGGQYVL
jgi:hypothetical protein